MQGARGQDLYIQLVAYPQLCRDEIDINSGKHMPACTSSHFRIPVSMGRFHEVKDTLFRYYEDQASHIAGASRVVASRFFPGVTLEVEAYMMEDLKAVAIKLNKKQTSSNYPCCWCVRHKSDLSCRSWVPTDVAKMKHPTFPRHIEKDGCTHKFKKNHTCGCAAPFARHLLSQMEKKYPTHDFDTTPTHDQSLPPAIKVDVDSMSDKLGFGIVGMPLRPDIDIHHRLYGVWHATQNCRVVMTKILKKAAQLIDSLPALKSRVSEKDIDLPHWKVADVPLEAPKKKKGGLSGGLSAMGIELSSDAKEFFDAQKSVEARSASRSSLDGEEMKRLMAHIRSVCDACRVHDDIHGVLVERPKSKALMGALVRMFDLWDIAMVPVLATSWPRDLSGDCERKLRAWADHIHASFNHQVGFPCDGADLLDVAPAHYLLEHFAEHAHLLYVTHGIAIGSLTDQAGEQYNQLVKRHLTAGQGSWTNGHMSRKTRDVHGRVAYPDNKFWVEMHRLHRLLFKHSLKHLTHAPRKFVNCGACGKGAGHAKNDRTKCPKHPLYQAPVPKYYQEE